MKIKKLPGGKRPFWAADCETDPFDGVTIPAPFIWGVYDGANYQSFDDTDAFVDFMAEQDVICYAHNGGKFDWHFITHRLEELQEILFIAGRMARFRIGKCEFRDSINLLPVPLSAFQKDEFDYDKLHHSVRHKYMPEIRTYLKSDCVNLFNFVSGFEADYGRHLTQATAAMRIWTGQFGGPSQRTGPAFFEEFKPYYYGGRVQCFRQGEYNQRALGADINSAYPFAMTHPHPIGKKFETVRGKPKAALSKWGPMFFDVECIARGCFPYRDTQKALYFPEENIRRLYKITGWELLAALRTGTIDADYKILRHYAFAETITFKEYVKFFWDKRQEFKAADNWAGQYYCKIFMNALYGKFAADPRRYHKHSIVHPDNLEKFLAEFASTDYYRFREWIVIRETMADREGHHSRQRFYNLATAASITGFVRAMLWEAITKSNKPFYCDTDSITAVGFPKEAVTLGPELGQWEIEGRYDRVIVAGKKLYAFHFTDDKRNGKDAGRWKVRSKGVRLNADDLIRIVQGHEVIFHPQAPTFSAHSTAPEFVPRTVRATAKDITRVPPELDPQNVTPVTGQD